MQYLLVSTNLLWVSCGVRHVFAVPDKIDYMSLVKGNNAHEPMRNRHLILLAEDHPLNQKVAKLLLQQMGFDVDIVDDGAAAVRAVKSTAYDAVLMDCHMPGMDGFEASRQIRQYELSNGVHIPIIAVTALAMAGDRERCLAAGMDDYMTKPIDRDLLREKLVYWMNPSSVAAVQSANKVIRLFEAPFVASADSKEEPVNTALLFDAYGEEAHDLLALFANSSERLIAQLKQAMEAGDCREIARLAHELKGASWAVGANELARLSVFTEQAAGQENWRLIHRTFVRLCHHFFEIQRFLESKGYTPAAEVVGRPPGRFPTNA